MAKKTEIHHVRLAKASSWSRVQFVLRLPPSPLHALSKQLMQQCNEIISLRLFNFSSSLPQNLNLVANCLKENIFIRSIYEDTQKDLNNL